MLILLRVLRLYLKKMGINCEMAYTKELCDFLEKNNININFSELKNRKKKVVNDNHREKREKEINRRKKQKLKKRKEDSRT